VAASAFGVGLLEGSTLVAALLGAAESCAPASLVNPLTEGPGGLSFVPDEAAVAATTSTRSSCATCGCWCEAAFSQWTCASWTGWGNVTATGSV
jgi:hypothetical protein